MTFCRYRSSCWLFVGFDPPVVDPVYIRCWGAQSWVRTSHFENAIEKVLMPNKAYIKECHLTGWVLLIFICKYLNIDIDCSYPLVANNIPIVFDLINNLHDMLLGSTKMTGRVWSLFTMIHRLCICSTLVFLFKSKKPLLQENERKVKKARASFPPHFSVQENAKKRKEKGNINKQGRRYLELAWCPCTRVIKKIITDWLMLAMDWYQILLISWGVHHGNVSASFASVNKTSTNFTASLVINPCSHFCYRNTLDLFNEYGPI